MDIAITGYMTKSTNALCIDQVHTVGIKRKTATTDVACIVTSAETAMSKLRQSTACHVFGGSSESMAVLIELQLN